MKEFIPTKVYAEYGVENYELGKVLIEKYKNMGIEIIDIQSHNKIPELRDMPDEAFGKMKRYLILGTRKSTKLIPNNLSADFIVPFTSSGCTAICLYCYLVCNFFKGSYLRVFVNRDDMMNSIKRKASKLNSPKIFELGCNSDMILENTLTGNLKWSIEEIGNIENARATFATKFSMVDDLLTAKHNGHTQMRISVNPKDIIRKIELGTSPLDDRIIAANKMFQAGYKIGLNIAPIILMDNWRNMYIELFQELHKKLDKNLQRQLFIELIFMTYGLTNEKINTVAFPNAINLMNKDIMKPKGRGKYTYTPELKYEAEKFIRRLVKNYFPYAKINYCV